jgi:hypothetical protein
MKKIYFFAALAAVALASCSNDETTAEYKGEVISFRPLMGNVTRAADQTVSTLQVANKGFFVTAIHSVGSTTYINDQQFTWSDPNYVSTPKYYWPAEGTLEFFAYAPTAVSNDQLSKTNYTTFTVTPSATIAEQIDFIYANTNGKSKTGAYTPVGGTASTYGAAGVPLNFRHTGAKIVVKVKNSVDNNLKFEITGWKLVNVDGSATFTYNNTATTGDETTDGKDSKQLLYTDWTGNADAQTVAYTSATFSANTVDKQLTTSKYLSSTAGDGSAEDQSLNMILIPQQTTAAAKYSAASSNAAVTTGSYIALQMVIKNSSDNVVIADASTTVSSHTKWAMWPVAFNWVPGKKYTYTIDLAGGGYWEINDDTDDDLDPILENAEIKFVDVTVDNWIDAEGINVTGGI